MLHMAAENCIAINYVISALHKKVFVAEEMDEGLGRPPRTLGMKKAYTGTVKEK
jgi:hypothetical protein